MKHDPPITQPPAPTEAARKRDDDASEHAREHPRPVSAEQMAAPSKRIWRRARRFASSR